MKHNQSSSSRQQIAKQLESFFWLKKPESLGVSIDGYAVHPSLTSFEGESDVLALLSSVLKFRDSIPSVEQQNIDPEGKFFQSLCLHQCAFDIAY